MIPYEWIHLLVSLFLPLSIGYALVVLLCRRLSMDMLPSLAISYGLGMGILSQWMLLLGMAKIPLNLVTIGIPLTFIALSLSILALIKLKKNPLSADANPSLWATDPEALTSPCLPYMIFGLIMGAYVLYNVIFVLWCSLNIPVQSWDAVATSAFKAKVFFFDGSIHRLNLPHASYPLHIPFTETWTALILGRWHETLIKIIFPATFFSYAILHYSYLKSLTSPRWALGGLCILLSSNFMVYHATIAYRDLTMMYYNCTTIILMLLWNRKKDDGLLILTSLFAGFTTFVKLEGTGYLANYTLLLLFILWKEKTLRMGSKIEKFFKFALPSYGICLLYQGYKFSLNIAALHGRLKPVINPDQLLRVPVIFREFASNLFLSGNWNLLWFILLISFVVNFSKIKYQHEIKLLSLTLAIFFGVYLILPMLTSTLIDHPTLLSRVLLHFFPLSVLLIVLLNYHENNDTCR